MPQPQRDTAVDVLRGFGMLLVVVGHLYSGPWTHYIYSFHMPLFFFLSGFCAARKERQEPFGQYVLKKCRTLLLPYVVFFFLSLLIIFFLYHDKPSVWPGGLSVPAVLKALVLSGGYLIRIPLYNYPLWYLPHLFAADLIFYWLRRGFALLPRIWLQRTAAGAVALAQQLQGLLPGVGIILLVQLSEPMGGAPVWVRHIENVAAYLRTDGRHAAHHPPAGVLAEGAEEIMSGLSPVRQVRHHNVSAGPQGHGGKTGGDGGLAGLGVYIGDDDIGIPKGRQPIGLLGRRNGGVIFLNGISGVEVDELQAAVVEAVHLEEGKGHAGHLLDLLPHTPHFQIAGHFGGIQLVLPQKIRGGAVILGDGVDGGDAGE